MMGNRDWARGAVSVMFLLAAGAAWGNGDESAEPGPSAADQQAMAEAWEKAVTPGEQHAWLMESEGAWKVKTTAWLQPGAEPEVNEGTARREAILGGRVLREAFDSTLMGRPFRGVAHSGYDNVAGTFWVTWMDNMSTGVFTGEGTCREDRSRCSYQVSGTDPMTGGEHAMRVEIAFEGDREVHTFYEDRGGEEFRTMELVYTRPEN